MATDKAIFRFKQFSIAQNQCGMKVGTDGVLLGVWCQLEHQPKSILDIGAGTGLIALMLAQRSFADYIDAIEIEDNAYVQTVENFENSPWADRLFCYHADFQDFIEEMKGEGTYDLIVSNPPYFKNTDAAKRVDAQRAKARFNKHLSFESLIKGVSQLLSGQGRFAVIIPYEDRKNFIAIARNLNLYPLHITNVRGRAESKLKRCLIQFSREESTPLKDELIIEISRHLYTEAYRDLCKDFYLKM